MVGTIFDGRDELLTGYVKANGALNTLKLKQNTTLYNKMSAYGESFGIKNIGVVFQHIKQNITEIPNCYCGKPTSWGPAKLCYREFCSSKCAANSIKKKDKIRNTCIEKYGVSNPSKIPSVRDKAKATILARYGGWDYIQEKVEKTNLEKYGHKSPLKNDLVISKIKKTNLLRYGFENPQSNTHIQEKTKSTNIEKYGGPAPASSTVVLNKMVATTRVRYGADNISTSKIAEGVLHKINNKDWLVDANMTKTMTVIAKETNLTPRTISKRFKKFGLVYKRHSASIFEYEVYNFITSVTTNVIRNVRGILDKLEIDIFLPDFNIAIECNGSYWHSELNGKGEFYHLNKTRLCNDKNIHLLHIWEHDWKNKKDIIKSRILHLLCKSRKVYARECIIKEIDETTKNTFLSLHCIRGGCEPSMNYGLYFGSDLVSIMCFDMAGGVIIRFTSSCAVIGGASKLFSCFINIHKPKKVIARTFNDWDTGAIYEMLGFVNKSFIGPKCLYTADYIKFYDISPSDIYDKVWDCGQTEWVWQQRID